ncbi:hypothetical protein ACOSP7_009054 [Xanthoceras sorbifolium]
MPEEVSSLLPCFLKSSCRRCGLLLCNEGSIESSKSSHRRHPQQKMPSVFSEEETCLLFNGGGIVPHLFRETANLHS